MEALVASAAGVEGGITGFRSDLGKKAESLGTVWGKFLQRVGNRGDVLTMALAFYSAIEQVCMCLASPLCLCTLFGVYKGSNVLSHGCVRYIEVLDCHTYIT